MHNIASLLAPLCATPTSPSAPVLSTVPPAAVTAVCTATAAATAAAAAAAAASDDPRLAAAATSATASGTERVEFDDDFIAGSFVVA